MPRLNPLIGFAFIRNVRCIDSYHSTRSYSRVDQSFLYSTRLIGYCILHAIAQYKQTKSITYMKYRDAVITAQAQVYGDGIRKGTKFLIKYTRSSILSAATISVFLLLWAGCIQNPTASNDQIPTSISVSTSRLDLDIGETAVITARVLDQNGLQILNATLSWSSSDPAGISVNSHGVLTALSFGMAEITVTSGTISAVIRVTVSIDRAALVAFYKAMGGPQWENGTNWLSSQPVNEWHGVTLNASGRVERLNLDYNGLLGELPSALGDLDELKSLSLDGNMIGGFPADIGRLTMLDSLSLSRNPIKRIPPIVGELQSLTYLSLNDCQLVGEIPSFLVNLGNLEELNLHRNEFSGEIPAILGNLTNLKHLRLSDNSLGGEVPASLEKLTSLVLLDIHRNRLSGNLPDELGNLSSLETLTLSSNELSGEIPSSLGNLVSIESLNLDQNELSGEIPSSLGNLENLTHMSLQYNQLSGEIPSSLGNLANIEQIDLDVNQLSGKIPASLGRLTSLVGLSIRGNQLSGEIPFEVGNISSLRSLTIENNQLTGHIPPSLGNLGNLEELRLSLNQLSGEIPPSLGNLGNLRYLFLDSNMLAGSIPPEFGRLTGLLFLILDNNSQMKGPLPLELINLTQLQNLFLHRTNLCVPHNSKFLDWMLEVNFLFETNRPEDIPLCTGN